MKKHKGFIPIIFIIIGVVIIASATFGVVKYKDKITASVISVFKKSEINTENKELIPKESTTGNETIKEITTEEKQSSDGQLQTQLKETERKRLEAERQLVEEMARQERLKNEQEIERISQETKKAEAEAKRIKAEQEEEQRLAEEHARQEAEKVEAESTAKKQAEARAIAEAEAKRQAEAQAQAQAEADVAARAAAKLQEEYSYYIQKLTTTRTNLISKKETTTSAINQIDYLYAQDATNAYLSYQNALAQAQATYRSEISQIANYYCSRGLCFSGMRVAAEAGAKQKYENNILSLENTYNQSLLNLINHYNQMEVDLKNSLNTINSEIEDIDYLINKLRQGILSAVDQLLLNKVLAY